MLSKDTYQNFLELLGSELVPALGCTEPIAIAYASAKAREVLGRMPEHIFVECSGNIIKNVKGAVVPTTGNLRGVEASAILGIVGGDSNRKLEVLTDVRSEDVEKTRELLKTGICRVQLIKDVENLFIKVTVDNGAESASVKIVDTHTNIVEIKKNSDVVFKTDYTVQTDRKLDKAMFNVDSIYEFANKVDILDIEKVIGTQINYNSQIAEEGLKNSYGANIGKTLLRSNHDIKTVAKAYSAAGSDARMAGCTLPVVINSGSGNQGLAVSMPVIKYAEKLKVPREKLQRALVLSNLLALYQKAGMGKLSAYCGAVSAACGAGAGIAYLYDASLDTIKMTIKNTLGNVAGIVCDGAKSSCAAKIASSVDASIMGYEMAVNGQVFSDGEGIIVEDVDQTIENVARLASEGMKATDLNILEMMTNSNGEK